VIALAVVVEGWTEKDFVKEVLAVHLQSQGVDPRPTLIGKGRRKEGGGDVTVNQLAKDMANRYRSPEIDYVTSLVDLYGFRDERGVAAEQLEKNIETAVGKMLKGDWDQSRVFAHVQPHEFEGLLFSAVDAFGGLSAVSAGVVEKLRGIRRQFPTPEHIDNDRATAPSARIKGLVPSYNKRSDGPVLALEMTLETIRSECPHFNEWVSKMESLPLSHGRH